MHNEDGAGVLDFIGILIVVFAFLIMIQLTLIALRNEARLTEVVNVIINDCSIEG